MAEWGKAPNHSHSRVMRIKWDVHQVLMPTLDTLIIGIGLLGHSLVIYILAGRRRKRMSRSLYGTDTLLLALSVSDVLLLLSLPFHTVSIAMSNWPFGSFLCKTVSFLGVACNTVNAFILALLAVTRYLTVVHPTWSYRSSMQRWLQASAVLLWLPALGLAAPQFAYRMVGSVVVTHCFPYLSGTSQVVYSIALFLCGFALPLVVIVFMYAKLYAFLRRTSMQGHAPQLDRYQKQVTKTTALLVVVFTICWLPSYALMFSRVGQSIYDNTELRSLAMFIRLLATSSSVINPLLYAFVSRKFRRDLLELAGMRCRECRASRWLACLPCRGRDMIQPFNSADLETSTPVPCQS